MATIGFEEAVMKVGAFFFGGVEMSDAGAGLPHPMDRRYDNAAYWDATLKYIDAAVTADPTYPDARAFRAIVFFRLGQFAASHAELASAAGGLGPSSVGS